MALFDANGRGFGGCWIDCDSSRCLQQPAEHRLVPGPAADPKKSPNLYPEGPLHSHPEGSLFAMMCRAGVLGASRGWKIARAAGGGVGLLFIHATKGLCGRRRPEKPLNWCCPACVVPAWGLDRADGIEPAPRPRLYAGIAPGAGGLLQALRPSYYLIPAIVLFGTSTWWARGLISRRWISSCHRRFRLTHIGIFLDSHRAARGCGRPLAPPPARSCGRSSCPMSARRSWGVS